MEISYYLNGEQTDNLCCSMNEGKEKVTFSMGYTVKSKEWNSKKGEFKSDDIHSFTLVRLKQYLFKRYNELKNDKKTAVLTSLKDEILSQTGESGIEAIDGMLFDEMNKDTDIPKYNEFIYAFEKFSNLKREEYKVMVLDYQMHFHTRNDVYEMDTYEGKSKLLDYLIEKNSYDEILLLTDENIWEEIYIDGGIEKPVFLSAMLSEWENYWNKQFEEEGILTGKTNRLKELKEQSWRAFQVYLDCYDSEVNVIKLAYTIDSFILYPVAVLAMMNCFDRDCCYSEYCEAEFNDNTWQCIMPDDMEDDGPYFYIRTYDE